MSNMTIPQSKINDFQSYLVSENKASATIREHIRYANRFAGFVASRKLSKQLLKEYRQYIDESYSTYNSKNSCITYVNALLKFLGKDELIIHYFESSRVATKLKTPALTDDDITTLLNYADNHQKRV